MFGFSSIAVQLFQGSVERTWNCVSNFTNLLWFKFIHSGHPAMPRSRRRHHSRSRSRSRSHSHDKDRDAKRRKIDSVESPTHKSSISSSERQSPVSEPVEYQLSAPVENQVARITETLASTTRDEKLDDLTVSEAANQNDEKPIKQIERKLSITPKKTLSPKQVQKKLESEKKRQQKQAEREERERKKHEEKERKEQLKKEKNEEKAKERELKEEQKRKEREEKESKKREKEEREEAKRKEREQEKLKKQHELEEKNREKRKIEEKKQKAAEAFVSFFVAKKTESKLDEGKSKLFMPFEVKSDMRMAPLLRRDALSDEDKTKLIETMDSSDPRSYLDEIKKNVRKCLKTWPYEDDDVIVMEEDFGESICEDKQKLQKMQVKFLKFHENRRPAFYGTWRKKSEIINGRKPFVEDKKYFDYDVDSDDDWEEEEQGESLNGSDDEEKENEQGNDDYEVDNEFFVPHGHLSDDEIDDEATAKLSPESLKQKLKLLKDEFDKDMNTRTNKMKPRSIGCIWYKKDKSNVDPAIDKHLRPLAMITNGIVALKKRSEVITVAKKYVKELRPELIPLFLKMVDGNVNRKGIVFEEFLKQMQHAGNVDVSKSQLGRCLKQFAQWRKCTEEGPMLNKFCWCVEDDAKKKYLLES